MIALIYNDTPSLTEAFFSSCNDKGDIGAVNVSETVNESPTSVVVVNLAQAYVRMLPIPRDFLYSISMVHQIMPDLVRSLSFEALGHRLLLNDCRHNRLPFHTDQCPQLTDVRHPLAQTPSMPSILAGLLDKATTISVPSRKNLEFLGTYLWRLN